LEDNNKVESNERVCDNLNCIHMFQGKSIVHLHLTWQ